MSECPRHRQPRKMYQGELAYSIRLAKQRNVEKLDLLLFQFAKAGESPRLILSKEPGNVLLRVSYKGAIGYDWVSLGLSCMQHQSRSGFAGEHTQHAHTAVSRPIEPTDLPGVQLGFADSNRTINNKCKAVVRCSYVQLRRGVWL